MSIVTARPGRQTARRDGEDGDLHDDQDLRWLDAAHRAQLRQGRLRIPVRANLVHRAVLVSVPNRAAGTEVAWVDTDLATLVRLCWRLGVRVVESCQDVGAEQWGDDREPSADATLGSGPAEARSVLWLQGPADVRRLSWLLQEVPGERWRWHGYRYWLRLPLAEFSVQMPQEHLPIAVARLQAQLEPTGAPAPAAAPSRP